MLEIPEAIVIVAQLSQTIKDKRPFRMHRSGSCLTVSYNVKSETEVHEVMKLAKKAGAVIAKEPQRVFGGGYSGYFTDLNGYYWEVAYNPHWSFDENDMLVL